LPTGQRVANGQCNGEKWSKLPFEYLRAVGLGVVGRSWWFPTKDTYQRRRKNRKEAASVKYVPNMSRKACERSPNRPNHGNLARHVEALRYKFGSNPLEYVMCVAVALPQVVEGVGA